MCLRYHHNSTPPQISNPPHFLLQEQCSVAVGNGGVDHPGFPRINRSRNLSPFCLLLNVRFTMNALFDLFHTVTLSFILFQFSKDGCSIIRHSRVRTHCEHCRTRSFRSSYEMQSNLQTNPRTLWTCLIWMFISLSFEVLCCNDCERSSRTIWDHKEGTCPTRRGHSNEVSFLH